MTIKFAQSDSLVASLCREAERIRSRCRVFSESNARCLDARLSRRLLKEFHSLKKRLEDIKHSAQTLKNDGHYDSIAIDFLIEVCSRPLSFDRCMNMI